MHIVCLCRGARKWVFLSAVILLIAYFILFSEQISSVSDRRFRNPSSFGRKQHQTTSEGKGLGFEQHPFVGGSSSIDQGLAQDDFSTEYGSSVEATDSGQSTMPSSTFMTTATSAYISTAKGEHTSLDPNSLPLATPSFIEDAHALPSNDAFMPHFSAIPSTIKNLTVKEAIGSCDYTEKELSHFQYEHDAYWRVNLTPDLFIGVKRHEWQTFIQRSLIPWLSVSSRFEGQGIIVVAGHPKSIKRLKVSLRALLNLGTTLPVELHYYGEEMDEVVKEELRAIYDKPFTTGTRLYFNDLAGSDQIIPSTYNKRTKINYQLKTAALINSRFAEPLLLDSDNVPAIDPTEIFRSKTYKEYGSVFWPDFSRTRPEHPAWAITNFPCRRDEYEFESGQVVVDKRRMFYHLQLAAWWNEQSYYNDILLGDKDTFRYAWHALRTKYGTPKKWITSVGFVADQLVDDEDPYGETRQGYCGHTFAQHHPDFTETDLSNPEGESGIAFFHGGTLKSISAPLMTRLRENKGGIFTHYKRSTFDEDWSGIEYNVGLRYWNAGFYYNVTEEPYLTGEEDFDLDDEPLGDTGIQALQLTDEDRMEGKALCTDWGEVEAKPLALIGEDGFDSRFERAGGYWMIEDNYRWGKSGA